MFKVLRIVLPLCFCLIQACAHKTSDETIKMDLDKAAQLNTQLGLAYLKQGNRPRAKRKLLTALKQAPSSPDTNAALAYFFEQTHELEQAQKFYSNALFLSSNGGSQLNNYGAFLCRQGRYQQAEQYFLKAVHDIQYLHTAAAYENAGLCALAKPDDEKARLYFIAAIDHDPSRKASLYELVKLEDKKGQGTEALKHLKKYPALVLSDKQLLTLAAQVAKNTGNTKTAAYYESILNNQLQKNDQSGAQNEYSNNLG